MYDDVSGLLIYKTTVDNCDGSFDLVVAASSAKEAVELFVKEIKYEKWKKIAENEFREALDDWESLNDDERRDNPTLPYCLYGWIVQAEAE